MIKIFNKKMKIFKNKINNLKMCNNYLEKVKKQKKKRK